MRTAIIVHYENEDFISNIDNRLFTIYYNSKRFKYVYLYLNKSNKEKCIDILEKSNFTLKIQDSLMDVESIAI